MLVASWHGNCFKISVKKFQGSTMDRDKVQSYVASVEQTVRNIHLDLKVTTSQFEELCQRVTPDRVVPPTVITYVRKTYKDIQDQMTRIRELNQLLQTKYRQYCHKDTLRDKEITQSVFFTKNLYMKFESTLQEIEAKKKLKEKGEGSETHGQHPSSPWFHIKENQVLLLRNLRNLPDLRYNAPPGLGIDKRRRIIHDNLRSLSLFVLSGETGLIDVLQDRMHLREYDLKERYAKDEIRGALTHLREISPSEVEKVMRRFADSGEFSKLKCLLFTVQSQKDLAKDMLNSTNKILRTTMEGEVKTLLF